MSRPQCKKALLAVSLVGTIRKDGKPHNPYSAAKQAGTTPSQVYYYLKKQKTLEWDK
jgi:hypothetical protein